MPKSLNLYARKEYGNNRMQYDFWGTGYYPKKLTLATGGNDFYGKSKDRIGAEMSKECAFATMNYEPYVLFLNGEYWGFYYLAEKYDEHYIEHYYHVNEDNIIMIKTGSLEVGESDDVLLYETMKTFVESTDMSLDENYKKACTMIDIESFIDYYAAEIFMARCGDWPIGNYALWRSRKTSLQPYEDCKWRYMLFDVNSSAFSSDLVEHDTLDWVLSLDPIFRSLSENQDFRENFSIRLCEMRDIVFEKRKVTDRLEEYRILMNDPMDKHLQRFFSKNQGTFNRRIDNMEGFINQRKDYIEVMLENNGF